MTFSINDFRSNVTNQNYFTKENAFELVVTLPSGLSSYDTNVITLNCSVANLPGTSINGVNVQRGTNSLQEELPLGKTFEDLSVIIRSDGEANILGLFFDWQELIYDDTGTGTTANQIAYPSDYISTIVLNHFDLQGNQLAAWTFQEARPKQNSTVSFGWDSSGIVSIGVTFKYKKYTKSIIGQTNNSNTLSNLTGNQSIDPNTGLPINSINF